MKKYLFYFVIMLVIGACKKVVIEDPVIFSGITAYNELGTLISEDSTDWQLFDQWQSSERALFDGKQNDFCDTVGQVFSILAYPNPSSDLIIINATRPDFSRISLRLVDQAFNVLYSKDTTISTSWMLNPGLLNFEGDLIRLYYKFTAEDCELRGHGDIQVIK